MQKLYYEMRNSLATIRFYARFWKHEKNFTSINDLTATFSDLSFFNKRAAV